MKMYCRQCGNRVDGGRGSPNGILARIGMWLFVLGGFVGPIILADNILEIVAPELSRIRGDGFMFAVYVIAAAFWIPLYAVTKQARLGGDYSSTVIEHDPPLPY
jgi:hypothetical protein